MVQEETFSHQINEKFNLLVFVVLSYSHSPCNSVILGTKGTFYCAGGIINVFPTVQKITEIIIRENSHIPEVCQ